MARLPKRTQNNLPVEALESRASSAGHDMIHSSKWLYVTLFFNMICFVLPVCVKGNSGILEKAPIPAFPGAEGAGAFTPGGRGGGVFEVTNLKDSGSGSLRDAIEANGARIVVFRVSGIITLDSLLTISNPYVTVAGQTAPGDGICIRGQTREINTHNVVLRYLRFRRGNIKNCNDALGGYPVRNIINTLH